MSSYNTNKKHIQSVVGRMEQLNKNIKHWEAVLEAFQARGYSDGHIQYIENKIDELNTEFLKLIDKN